MTKVRSNNVITEQEGLFLPSILLNPLPNYETEKVANFIEDLFPAMVKLFREKDINYNGSWQNEGILSAQANFNRKVDRIKAQFKNGTIYLPTNENISDTLIDNAIYSLMYLFYLTEKVPEVKDQILIFLEKYKN